jgi:hypothetical protein
MRLGLLSVLAAGLLLAACGGGDGDGSPTPIGDPAEAVSQAADATAELDSFHMEITYSPIGAPIVYSVDYERGNYAEHIPLPETGGASDFVFHGDRTYRRDCTPDGACGNWLSEAGDRLTVPSLVGKVNSVPETLPPYIARMAKGLTLSDPATMKFSGMIDLPAAVRENQYRAFLASGYSEQEAADFVRQLAAQQPAQSESALDIWLTADARYIAKVTAYVPGQPTDPYFEATYSSYNAVTVKPPAGFS